MDYLYSDKPFELECGETLPNIQIAYSTYGKLNDKKDNCIWVCHALTADSNVDKWWPHTVEKNRFLDPDKYFIVCANILGSCYGSTGPLSINSKTGKKWFNSFPKISIRDMVKAHILLSNYLKIERIKMLIGSSLGGFQAIEWAIMEPKRIDNLVLIATSHKATPWTIAIDETQRMAIEADQTYGDLNEKAGAGGLATARALALLTYRGSDGYNATQQDTLESTEKAFRVHRASTYQKHQGEKLVNRFDAYSYVSILNSFDSHDITRKRGDLISVLKTIGCPTLCIGISTDILFPPLEMKQLADLLSHGEYREIESKFGHDGFLVEHETLNKLITEFITKRQI